MTGLAEIIERDGVTLFHGMNWEYWGSTAPSWEPNADNLFDFAKQHLDAYGLTHVELVHVPPGVYNTTKSLKAAYFAGPNISSGADATKVANKVFDDFLDHVEPNREAYLTRRGI